jgi:potassium-dependent mechanosensitive channel
MFRGFFQGWRRSRPPGRQNLILFLAAVFLVLGCSIGPARASSPAGITQPKATVFLDGYPLFQIAASGNLSARERASRIEAILEEHLDRVLNSSQTLEVRQEKPTVLRIGDRYLLTATEADVSMPGMPVAEQAEWWQHQIETAIARAQRERTPAYQRWAVKMAVGSMGMAIALHISLFGLARRIRRRSLQQSGREMAAWQLLGLHLLQLLGWTAAIGYAAYVFPLSRRCLSRIYLFATQTFNSEIIALGQEGLSLNRILFLAAVAIALWLGVDRLTHLFKTRLLPLAGVDPASRNAIGFFTRYALLFLGLLFLLSAAGVDFTSLAILFSFLGVGIGFGLQNIAKDFISGLITIVDRPIKVGELVQVGDTQGLVQRIGARYTEITTIDRVTIFIPNSRFVEGEVRNWNRSGLTRVKLYVGAAYGSDIQMVHRALSAAARVPHPDILRHPPPKAQFRGFGENSLTFRIVAFVRDPLKLPKAKTHLYNQMEFYLRKYNIHIPCPQRDMHLKLPQLEQIVDTWLHNNALPQSHLYYPNGVVPQQQDGLALAVEDDEAIPAEYDWEAIVAQMRGAEGVEIRDRRHHFRIFRKCFLGSEAVEWLIQREEATRQEAIAIGEMMVEMGIIHHVLDEHGFKDEPLFYRFWADEEGDRALRARAMSQQSVWEDGGIEEEEPWPETASEMNADSGEF